MSRLYLVSRICAYKVAEKAYGVFITPPTGCSRTLFEASDHSYSVSLEHNIFVSSLSCHSALSSMMQFFAFGPNVLVLLPILFLAYCVAWIVYARYFHPLAKYPGPFFASVTRLWLIVDVARGNCEKTQRRLHEQYGGLN